MNQQIFFSNVLDYFKKDGYSFFVPDQEFYDPKKLSRGKQALLAAVVGAGYGLLGGLSSGYMDRTDTESLVKDLRRMNEHCDLVGIRLSNGNVVLRLVIDGDDLSGETIVGRFVLIHERAYDFRKYAITVLRTLYSDGKLPTYAIVLVAFSSHKNAKDFIRCFAEKCKHVAFWKKVYTHVWVVDLEDEEITRFPEPLIDLGGARFEKIKIELFRKS